MPYLIVIYIYAALTSIIIIHAPNGWFVGEHGSGGIEYSFLLIIAFIVIAAESREQKG